MTRRSELKINLPSQGRLIELLDYDPALGCFYWKPRIPEDFCFAKFPEACARQFNSYYAGARCFATLLDSEQPHYGYTGVIEGISYPAGRIAWKIFYGTDPDEISAINGDLRDTRIANLRNAQVPIAHRNKRLSLNNTSGARGVYWNKQKRKWQAQITVNNKRVPLGRFDLLEDAVAARAEAERKHWERGS